ncbi:MAG TPA: flippase [Methylocella sp.]|nr:flippase [Methylocella sp.]
MRGLKANFVFNVIGPVLSLIVMIVATPVYIAHIGNARYGLLAITWRLLGYFGFIDLGMSRASANALAKLGDPLAAHERAKVLMTALWINLLLGALGGLLFYFSGLFFIERLLEMPADLAPEIRDSLPWVAFLVPLALTGGIAYGALESRERFLTANILQVFAATAGVIAPVLCAVYISPSLTVVLPAAVLARILSVLLALFFALRGEEGLSPWLFDWKRGRALLGYGGWISISNILGPILASVDQLMIGSVLGVAAVAYYAVPMSLVVRSQLLAGALSRTLFPRLSRATHEEAKEMAAKALITLAYAYGAICAAASVLMSPFLEFWMGKDFGSVSGPIGGLLLIGAWTNGLSFIFFALLQGQGRPDIVAKTHVFEIVPYILVLWVLLNHFGVMGAAASWTLMVTVEVLIVFIASRLGTAYLVRLLPPLGFIAAASLYAIVLSPPLLHAILAAALFGAMTCAGALIFDASARELVATLHPFKMFNAMARK